MATPLDALYVAFADLFVEGRAMPDPLMRKIGGLAAMVALTLVVGCTRPNNPERYDRANTDISARTYRGIVLSVRQVEVSGQQGGSNTAGNIAGGALGGVAGSTVGGGRGGLLSAIVGVVGGVIAADKVQELATAHKAYEYVVEIEAPLERREGTVASSNANITYSVEKILRTVIQQDERPLAVGSRVFMIDSKDPRVVPDSAAAAQPKVDLKN